KLGRRPPPSAEAPALPKAGPDVPPRYRDPSFRLDKTKLREDFSLPVPVRPVEKLRHIPPNRGGERGESRIVAGAAQLLDRGLREILVTIADRGWHVDVFDFGGPAQRHEHRLDHLAKALRFAGPHIEQPIDRRRADEPAHHRSHILDVNEIT